MAEVRAVPAGYGTATVDLTIRGASDALEFYKRAFGAEELGVLRTPDGKIMHAELRIGNSVIMLSEAFATEPTRSAIHLYVEDVESWWKRATEVGAKVVTPLTDMFWGDRYGVVTDRWGNRWSLATHRVDVPLEEVRRLGMEAMKKMQEAASQSPATTRSAVRGQRTTSHRAHS